jgi:ornithine cyclodeaminase
MLYINQKEVERILDMKSLIELTEEGFKLFSEGKTLTPPFINFLIENVQGHVHFKSGYIMGDDFFTLKYSGGFWGNEDKNIPVDNGLFLVFSAITGEPVAIVNDVGYLTTFRTGVAGAIANKYLARENSKVATIIGTGEQARIQIEALLQVRPIEKVNVWGRNPRNVDGYMKDLSLKHPDLIVKKHSSIESAMQDADIIITTTYSDRPLIQCEWVKPGMHITAVGACGPQMQELDEKILKIATRVFADSKEMCIQNGEIHHAIKNGFVKEENIVEIGEVLKNPAKYRRNPEDITVADLVGLGFQDAIAGSFVYKKAMENKLGMQIG